MPLEGIGDIAGRVVDINKAKAARGKLRAAKAKPAPMVLPDGKHFSRCPAAAVFDPALTDGEVRGLAAAGAFTGKDGICRASQMTIAKRLGVCRQTVHRWFAALVAKGYLRLMRRTRRANGSDGPNVYQLVYPPLPEIESGRPRDAQGVGAGYPTSGNGLSSTSDAPNAKSPGASARMTT